MDAVNMNVTAHNMNETSKYSDLPCSGHFSKEGFLLEFNVIRNSKPGHAF